MKDDISFAKLVQLRSENFMLYQLSMFLIKVKLTHIASKWLHH